MARATDGKTTTAQNLAVAAMEVGQTVALIDLDSQPTSANWGDRRAGESPAVVSAQVARLKPVLDAAAKQGSTLAILDTPPRTSEATLEAAKVADLVLAPVRPIINDMETLPALRELVTLAGSPRTYVLINAAPAQGGLYAEAQQAAEGMGFDVCPVVLRQRLSMRGRGLGFSPRRLSRARASVLLPAVHGLSPLCSRHPRPRSRVPREIRRGRPSSV